MIGILGVFGIEYLKQKYSPRSREIKGVPKRNIKFPKRKLVIPKREVWVPRSGQQNNSSPKQYLKL